MHCKVLTLGGSVLECKKAKFLQPEEPGLSCISPACTFGWWYCVSELSTPPSLETEQTGNGCFPVQSDGSPYVSIYLLTLWWDKSDICSVEIKFFETRTSYTALVVTSSWLQVILLPPWECSYTLLYLPRLKTIMGFFLLSGSLDMSCSAFLCPSHCRD